MIYRDDELQKTEQKYYSPYDHEFYKNKISLNDIIILGSVLMALIGGSLFVLYELWIL